MPMGPNMLWSACRVASAGDFLGTAFVIGVPSQIHPVRWNYLVTADHVVRNRGPVEVEIPDGDTGELQPPFVVQEQHWWQPFDKVDLRIASLDAAKIDTPLNLRSTAMDFQALRPGQEPMLGMPLYYIGIFRASSKLETPMARGGTIGSPAINIVKEPTKKSPHRYEYDAHLVDCRSYRGFSGSPCFVELLHPVLNSEIQPFGPLDPNMPDLTNGEAPKLGVLTSFVPLAGIFTAHFTDEGKETNRDDTVSRYGVGVMLPVRYLWEALMSEDGCRQRQELDQFETLRRAAEDIQAEDAGAGPPPAVPGEFERFADTLSKLAQVPKSEIDEQRAKE
jgi:hypothetical protein